jgi:hypothetical protein
MQQELERIKKSGKKATFLLPSLPSAVSGKIASLTATKVVIEATMGGETYQYATHPNTVVLVTKKP